MLGLKSLIIFANKFKTEKIPGVSFLYSFNTPELRQLLAGQNKIDKDYNEILIRDRLSFLKLRDGENVILIIEP